MRGYNNTFSSPPTNPSHYSNQTSSDSPHVVRINRVKLHFENGPLRFPPISSTQVTVHHPPRKFSSLKKNPSPFSQTCIEQRRGPRTSICQSAGDSRTRCKQTLVDALLNSGSRRNASACSICLFGLEVMEACVIKLASSAPFIYGILTGFLLKGHHRTHAAVLG
jgi:hypothetical protein